MSDFLSDQPTVLDDQFLRIERIVDIVRRATTGDSFGKADDLFLTFVNRPLPNTIAGTTILFRDDDIHRHVAEFPRQISGVGRLERGIGQAFSRTVGRNKVFENRKSLAEGGKNRTLDNLTRWFCHQTTRSAKLTNLLAISPSTGIHHQEDRVDLILALVLSKSIKHRFLNFISRTGRSEERRVGKEWSCRRWESDRKKES